MTLLQEVTEQQVAMKYLQDNGMVAIERGLAEQFQAEANKGGQRVIVYNPSSDSYHLAAKELIGSYKLYSNG